MTPLKWHLKSLEHPRITRKGDPDPEISPPAPKMAAPRGKRPSTVCPYVEISPPAPKVVSPTGIRLSLCALPVDQVEPALNRPFCYEVQQVTSVLKSLAWPVDKLSLPWEDLDPS